MVLIPFCAGWRSNQPQFAVTARAESSL